MLRFPFGGLGLYPRGLLGRYPRGLLGPPGLDPNLPDRVAELEHQDKTAWTVEQWRAYAELAVAELRAANTEIVALEDRIHALHLAAALKAYRRGPGRPQKLTHELTGGLLGSWPEKKRRGAPVKWDREFQRKFSAWVDRIKEERGLQTDKAAVEEVFRRIAKKEKMPFASYRAEVLNACKRLSEARKAIRKITKNPE